jgi:hypothetical protein
MPSSNYTTTVDLPVEARLVLLTVDNREVPITPEILREFTRDDTRNAYMNFKAQLARGLGVDIDDLPDAANTIRYMAECAFMYEHDFDYSANPDDPEDEDAASVRSMIAELRRVFNPAL